MGEAARRIRRIAYPTTPAAVPRYVTVTLNLDKAEHDEIEAMRASLNAELKKAARPEVSLDTFLVRGLIAQGKSAFLKAKAEHDQEGRRVLLPDEVMRRKA